MKKMISIIVAVVIVMELATGCGAAGGGSGSAGGGTSDISSMKTLGDIAKYDSNGYVYDDQTFMKLVEINGAYYRAQAALTPEVNDALNALDWEDPDREDKIAEIVAPLEITKMENLSEKQLPQEELDQLVGKTGEDLMNEGWSASGFLENGKETFMDYDSLQYKVTFDGTSEVNDDTPIEEVIKPLTVKAIEYAGVSSSALDFEE